MESVELKSETPARRDKLIEAASLLIQRQGYASTTLAEIAEASGVPLGSVYYYFKSKDDVLTAITDRRVNGLRHLLADDNESSGPQERLEALIRIWVTDKDVDAMYGCPIGSLCYEMAKQRGTLSREAARPLKFLLQWTEEQFRQLGCGDASPVYALHMITVLQGASLVANAFNNSDLILHETNHLKTWLESLVGPGLSRSGKLRRARPATRSRHREAINPINKGKRRQHA